MTAEEIEIIVTAKVEEALKEFEKFLPMIKQVVKEIQETFSQISTEKMKKEIKNATIFAKKKIEDLKKSTKDNEIAIKVNNKEAINQISQTKKQISSLKKQTTSRF